MALASALPVIQWPAVLAQLPEPALKRTYQIQCLQSSLRAIHLASVLKGVAPETYRGVKVRTPEAVYEALLHWCNQRFPTRNLESLMDWEEGPFGESWFHARIPIIVAGQDFSEGEIYSPALLLCLAMTPPDDPDDYYGYSGIPLREFDGLTEFLDVLPQGIEHGAVRPYKLPRGVHWKEPWTGFWDLWAYAHHQTGWGFLDETPLSLEESDAYPYWEIGEVKALVSHWKNAKPLWERISALANYIDQKPRERLPLLAGALMNNSAVVNQITQVHARMRSNWDNVRRAGRRLRPRVLAEAWT